MIVTSFLAIFVVCSTIGAICHDYPESKVVDLKVSDQNKVKNRRQRSSSEDGQESGYVAPDNGFYPFDFSIGNAGLDAEKKFYISVTKDTVFYVTDCLCAGDSFKLIINGNKRTPDFSSGACLGQTNCQDYSKDPAHCLYNPGWCWSANLLTPGTYTIELRVITGPYLSGTGYVMAQAWCADHPCCEDTKSCKLSVANIKNKY